MYLATQFGEVCQAQQMSPIEIKPYFLMGTWHGPRDSLPFCTAPLVAYRNSFLTKENIRCTTLLQHFSHRKIKTNGDNLKRSKSKFQRRCLLRPCCMKHNTSNKITGSKKNIYQEGKHCIYNLNETRALCFQHEFSFPVIIFQALFTLILSVNPSLFL